MSRHRRAAARLLARLKGYRTLAIFSPVALIAALDAVRAIDLTPLFEAAHVPEPSRSAIVTGMAVLAILLRIYTTTPPGQNTPPAGGQN